MKPHTLTLLVWPLLLSAAHAQQAATANPCLSNGLPVQINGGAYVVGCMQSRDAAVSPVTGMVGGYVNNQSQSLLDAFAGYIGRAHADVGLVYENQSNWAAADASAGWTVNTTSAPQKLSLAVPLLTASGGGTLEDVAAGKYDSHFKLWAQAAAARDPAMIIRIGWEMNGNWMPWSVKGNYAGYVAAYQHVWAIFHAASSRFLFDWCPNWGADNPEPAYPGDSYVTFIGLDIYDDGNGNADGNSRFQAMLNATNGLLWHQAFAAQHNKPMTYPEIGSSHDDGVWVTNMSNWMKANAVVYFDWWNVTVDVDSYLPGHPQTMAGFVAAWQSATTQIAQAATAAVVAASAVPAAINQAAATAAAVDAAPPPAVSAPAAQAAIAQAQAAAQQASGDAAVAAVIAQDASPPPPVPSVPVATTTGSVVSAAGGVPANVAASPNYFSVRKGGPGGIIDAGGNIWTITSGGQVAINGQVDPITANVTRLAYVNGVIWQQATGGAWWGESAPNQAWAGQQGVLTSPLPAPQVVAAAARQNVGMLQAQIAALTAQSQVQAAAVNAEVQALLVPAGTTMSATTQAQLAAIAAEAQASTATLQAQILALTARHERH